MATIIDYSVIESETLGLKIGRCNCDYFDETILYNLIIEGKYDLCRLKICAEDEFAPARLHKMGLPAFFSGSIRRYKTKMDQSPEGNYNYPDLLWEEFDGTQLELLKDMLRGTWGTYPIGYYRTPYLSTILNKEIELESLFKFYSHHNNPAINPNNTIVFIKHGEEYVGFFALNKLNGKLESHVGGILEPYRKGGYFLDKLRYIKEYCITHNLTHFIFGARNENSRVQRIFQHVGFEAIGSENVFHIPSLLSYTCNTAWNGTLTVHNGSSTYSKLSQNLSDIANQLLPNYSNSSFQLNEFQIQNLNTCIEIQYHIAVKTNLEVLIILMQQSPSEGILTGYFHAFHT